MNDTRTPLEVAFQLARQEAERLGAECGPEHLIIGIMKEGGVGAKILEKLGVKLGMVRDVTERLEASGYAAVIRERKREVLFLPKGKVPLTFRVIGGADQPIIVDARGDEP